LASKISDVSVGRCSTSCHESRVPKKKNKNEKQKQKTNEKTKKKKNK